MGRWFRRADGLRMFTRTNDVQMSFVLHMSFTLRWVEVSKKIKVRGMRVRDTDTVALEFHKKCVDLFSDAVILCSGSRVVHCNKSALGLLGIGGDGTCIGLSFADIFSQKNRPFFAEDYSSLACGIPISIEMRRMDGASLDAEIRISVLNLSREEEDALFVVFVREISKKMHAIRRLCAQNSRWTSLVEENKAALCIVSSGRIENVNQAAAHLLGYDHACELLHTPFVSLLDEDSRDIAHCGFEHLAQNAEYVWTRMVVGDGCSRHVGLRVVALDVPDSFMIEMRTLVVTRKKHPNLPERE